MAGMSTPFTAAVVSIGVGTLAWWFYKSVKWPASPKTDETDEDPSLMLLSRKANESAREAQPSEPLQKDPSSDNTRTCLSTSGSIVDLRKDEPFGPEDVDCTITVHCKEARDLSRKDQSIAAPGPFCCLSWRGETVKTSNAGNKINPIWNEELVLPYQYTVDSHVTLLRVEVYDSPLVAGQQLIGAVDYPLKPVQGDWQQFVAGRDLQGHLLISLSRTSASRKCSPVAAARDVLPPAIAAARELEALGGVGEMSPDLEATGGKPEVEAALNEDDKPSVPVDAEKEVAETEAVLNEDDKPSAPVDAEKECAEAEDVLHEDDTPSAPVDAEKECAEAEDVLHEDDTPSAPVDAEKECAEAEDVLHEDDTPSAPVDAEKECAEAEDVLHEDDTPSAPGDAEKESAEAEDALNEDDKPSAPVDAEEEKESAEAEAGPIQDNDVPMPAEKGSTEVDAGEATIHLPLTGAVEKGNNSAARKDETTPATAVLSEKVSSSGEEESEDGLGEESDNSDEIEVGRAAVNVLGPSFSDL